MFVGWTTRSKFLFGKFSYRLYNTALDGMDLLKIGPVNARETALKIDEVMWKTFKSDCASAVTGQEKSERKFLKLAERRKNPLQNRFQVEGNHRAHAQWHPDIRMPRLHVSEEDDPPLKSFSNSSG